MLVAVHSVDLTGQTVVLTGATCSTGALLTRRLKELGAVVIAVDSDRPGTTADLHYYVDMLDKHSITSAIDGLPCGIDMLCNVSGEGPGRQLPSGLRQYARGVVTFVEEALSLISNGGLIINISPLPEWDSDLGDRLHGRGIRVRHLKRKAEGASIVPAVLSELSACKYLYTYGLTKPQFRMANNP